MQLTADELEAIGVAREDAANKRMKGPGFVGDAAAYERDANQRSIDAGFTSAVDQEIDANRRAMEAGFLNAAVKENPAAAAPGTSIYSTEPFVDPRSAASPTQLPPQWIYNQPITPTSGDNENVQQQTVVSPDVQTMDMANLTSEMDLSNKLQEVINKDNPLFKAATTKAMQNMQRRGIVNSTLAQESVMNAIMAVGLPIAQAEVNNLMTNLYYNKDWTNKQKMQANEAAYNKMLTQLQGQINMTLQQLSGSQNIGLQALKGQQATALQTLVGQQEMTINQQKTAAHLWAKYGDWVTMMATTEGADQDAWKRMLDLLQGAGGWPKPTA